MEFEQIKELIKAVDNSHLNEVNISIDKVSIKIKKYPLETMAESKSASAAAGKSIASIENPVTIFPDEIKEDEEGLIKSPIVGVFYRKPASDKEPFVEVGSKVKRGETLCIIEAMKVMNEITSDRDGEVAAIYAQDGKMVEYGQPLFRISL